MAEMSHTDAQAEVSSQANAKNDEVAVYEAAFHLVSSLTEDEVAKVVERIREELSQAKAETIAEGFPQKMTLAYTIERPVSGGRRERHSASYFGWIKFEAAPEAAEALHATLRSMREVLRYLLITTIREDISAIPRRALFSSDRLEGKTIQKPTTTPEKKGEVSEEELNKSIEALVN
jgi:ribosomal protein S6